MQGEARSAQGGSTTTLIGQYQVDQANSNEEQPRPLGAGDLARLLVFPEGTTNNSRSLIHFKRGAFAAGLPVQPIALKYNNQNTNVAWTSGAVSHLFSLLSGWHNYLEVTLAPVYMPSEVEKADARSYATHVQRHLAAILGQPARAIHAKELLAYYHSKELPSASDE